MSGQGVRGRAGGGAPADVAMALHLELHETRDALAERRHDARRQLVRALAFTGLAGVLFGVEAWATWRGDPFFGWLVFVIFTGVATLFWSLRRKARGQAQVLEAEAQVLEGQAQVREAEARALEGQAQVLEAEARALEG